MSFNNIRRNLVCFSAVIATVSKISIAQESYAEQLDAVRQALLNEALSGQVEVFSSGYVDEDGELHESAYIQSHKRIRGVRIPSYTTSVEGDIASISRKADITDNGVCEPTRYQRNVGIQVKTLAEVEKTIGSISAGVLQKDAFDYLSYRLSNEKGILVSVMDNLDHATSYDRVLVPGFRATPPHVLELVVDLKRGGIVSGAGLLHATQKTFNNIWSRIPIANQLRGNSSPIPGDVSYRLILKRTGESGYVASVERDFKFRSRLGASGQEELPQKVQKRSRRILEEMIDELLSTLMCLPEELDIKNVLLTARGATLSLGAGEDVGISTGDRFVVLQRNVWRKETIEMRDLTYVALSEVTRVEQKYTDLEILAGDLPNNKSNLIAIPF